MPKNGRSVNETDAERIPLVLPEPQRHAILQLATSGPGGNFDSVVMTALYNAGLVTVGEEDRQVKLTEVGRETYRVPATDAISPRFEKSRPDCRST